MVSKKKLVVISSLDNEAITYSISKMTPIDYHFISLDNFLNSVTVFDEIDIHETKIHWEKDGLTINNDKNTLILSRLFYNSQAICNGFKVADKDYALAEIRAYLGFSINSFNTLNHALDENGHEISHPLPTQWEAIKNFNETYHVPDYYWGDYRFNHLQGEDLVYSEICNFKKWRKHKSSNEKMVFCFKKPKGKPYFSLVINGSALVTTPSIPDDSLVATKIANESIALAKQFNYFISESLYFYDGEKIISAFISPLVSYSKKNNQFNTFVHQHIQRAIEP